MDEEDEAGEGQGDEHEGVQNVDDDIGETKTMIRSSAIQG